MPVPGTKQTKTNLKQDAGSTGMIPLNVHIEYVLAVSSFIRPHWVPGTVVQIKRFGWNNRATSDALSNIRINFSVSCQFPQTEHHALVCRSLCSVQRRKNFLFTTWQCLTASRNNKAVITSWKRQMHNFKKYIWNGKGDLFRQSFLCKAIRLVNSSIRGEQGLIN